MISASRGSFLEAFSGEGRNSVCLQLIPAVIIIATVGISEKRHVNSLGLYVLTEESPRVCEQQPIMRLLSWKHG